MARRRMRGVRADHVQHAAGSSKKKRRQTNDWRACEWGNLNMRDCLTRSISAKGGALSRPDTTACLEEAKSDCKRRYSHNKTQRVACLEGMRHFVSGLRKRVPSLDGRRRTRR